MKVLLIEDDIEYADKLEKYLRKKILDISIKTFYSIEDVNSFMPELEDDEINLIIIDFYLGTQTAIDFLDFRPLLSIPKIVLSSSSDINAVKDSYRMGILDFISKDIGLDQIVEQITHKYIEYSRSILFDQLRSNKNLSSTISLLDKSITHDLSNKLSSLTILLEKIFDLAKISMNVNALKSIVIIQEIKDSLNQIGKIIALDSNSLKIEKLRISELIKPLVYYYKSKKVVLEFTDTAPEIYGYRELLQQVFNIAIGNCVKANLDQELLKIKISYLDGDLYYHRFLILDNGRGVPVDMFKKVFEPYFKLVPESDGMGIGLFILKSICKKHGGNAFFTKTVGTNWTTNLEINFLKNLDKL